MNLCIIWDESTSPHLWKFLPLFRLGESFFINFPTFNSSYNNDDMIICTENISPTFSQQKWTHWWHPLIFSLRKVTFLSLSLHQLPKNLLNHPCSRKMLHRGWKVCKGWTFSLHFLLWLFVQGSNIEREREARKGSRAKGQLKKLPRANFKSWM